jgi:hypothetical protein
LVHLVWNDPRFLLEGDKQLRLVWKLKELKTQTKIWNKEVKAREKALMVNLETKIKQYLTKIVDNHLSLEEEKHLARTGIKQK